MAVYLYINIRDLKNYLSKSDFQLILILRLNLDIIYSILVNSNNINSNM
jgi:hypothetical protein